MRIASAGLWQRYTSVNVSWPTEAIIEDLPVHRWTKYAWKGYELSYAWKRYEQTQQNMATNFRTILKGTNFRMHEKATNACLNLNLSRLYDSV